MGVSRRTGEFILAIGVFILRLTSGRLDQSCDPLGLYIASQLPKSLGTAMSKFQFDGEITVYAVCPACHCTYKSSFKPGSTTPIYPDRCTNVPIPDQPACNELLLQKDSPEQPSWPIRKFCFHSFHDFIGHLLSQPDLERQIDVSADHALAASAAPPLDIVSNFLDCNFLSNFECPESTPTACCLFIEHRGEKQLHWSASFDFFNPEGNTLSGTTKSCGILFMACFSLGLDICYKLEYIYVADFISGPKEPSLTALNYYIRPLTNQLLESWVRGVCYSRTAHHNTPQLLQSALVMCICDLPAACKILQLAGHSSHIYCTVCQSRSKQNLGDTNYADWVIRNNDNIQKYAETFCDALTAKEQTSIFMKHGVRWSDLWHLPYWNPSRQLVVDPMHAILEVLIQIHIREVLQLTTVAANAKDMTVTFNYHFRQPQIATDGLLEHELKQVLAIHTLLIAPIIMETPVAERELLDLDDICQRYKTFASLFKKISNKNVRALKFVWADIGGIKPAGKVKMYKKDYVEELIRWVSSSRFSG